MRVVVVLLLLLLSVLDGKSERNTGCADSLQRADSIRQADPCQQKDIFDYILKRFQEKPASNRKVTILGIPYVSYSPVTEFQFGAAATASWRFGHKEGTNLSASTFSGYITTQKQLVIQVKSNIYLNKNKVFLQGDWRFYMFRLPTYALGTENGYGVPSIATYSVDTSNMAVTSYPMTFNWVKFHQIVSRKILPNLYAGIGYHLDFHYQIEDLELKLDTPNVLITPHYAYSQLHGFSPEQYTSSGLSFNIVYDTRDNIINSYRGWFVNVNYKTYFKWMGSEEHASQVYIEMRKYVGLSKKTPRHILAFWMYGNFNVSGTVPFLDLTSTGFDQMNSSARGYIQGRWRGEELLYGEVEYRFPISLCSKVFGGVLFVNATTASNKDMGVKLFDAIKPAAGFGLRVMLSKKNRVNLQIDIGWGVKSNGFYLNAQDAF